MTNIILSAGGTGGHFFQAIALIEHFRANQKYDHVKFHIITDKKPIQYIKNSKDQILAQGNIFFHENHIHIKTNNPSKSFLDYLKISLSIFKSLKILLSIKGPKYIISFGSYHTIPNIVASIILRIPLIIHEQNAILGDTNLLFARFAKIIALSYPNTLRLNKLYENKSFLVGNLIRKKINHSSINSVANTTANNSGDIDSDSDIKHDFRILIIGGSQSAKFFDLLIPKTIISLAEQLKKQNKNLQSTNIQSKNIKLKITQQVSKENIEKISNLYNRHDIDCHIENFFENIGDLYKNTDLIISRAGALTVSEILHLELPGIFVPMKYSKNNHQELNLKYFSQKNCLIYYKENQLSSDILTAKLIGLITDPSKIYNIKNNIKQYKLDMEKNFQKVDFVKLIEKYCDISS